MKRILSLSLFLTTTTFCLSSQASNVDPRELAYELFSVFSSATSADVGECINGTPKSEIDPSEQPVVIDIVPDLCIQITFDSEESLESAKKVFGGKNRFQLFEQRIYLGPVRQYQVGS